MIQANISEEYLLNNRKINVLLYMQHLFINQYSVQYIRYLLYYTRISQIRFHLICANIIKHT